MKAWELARLILPSISSRAPYKTHLPAPQQDHGIFFLFRRTPPSTVLVAGHLGQPRLHLDQEDSSPLEGRARITCHNV